MFVPIRSLPKAERRIKHRTRLGSVLELLLFRGFQPTSLGGGLDFDSFPAECSGEPAVGVLVEIQARCRAYTGS